MSICFEKHLYIFAYINIFSKFFRIYIVFIYLILVIGVCSRNRATEKHCSVKQGRTETVRKQAAVCEFTANFLVIFHT